MDKNKETEKTIKKIPKLVKNKAKMRTKLSMVNSNRGIMMFK